MATSRRRPAIHPLRYIAGTVIFTLFGTAMLGVLTVAMYGAAVELGPPYPHLYVTALVGFGVVLSQEMFSEDITDTDVDRTDYDELPLYGKIGIFLFAVVVYNLLIFAALVAVNVSLTLGVGRAVYLIAFLYPVYDVRTGGKMNPLSVFGLLAWIVTLLNVAGWISGNIVDLVRDIELEPFRIVETLRYRRPG